MRRMLVAGLVAIAITCGAVHVYDKKPNSAAPPESRVGLDQFFRVARMDLSSTIHLRGRTQPASSTNLAVPSLRMIQSNHQLRSYIQGKGATVPHEFRSRFLVEDGTYVEKGDVVAIFDPTDYDRTLELWAEYITQQEFAYEALLAKNRETREGHADSLEVQAEQAKQRREDLADYLRQDAQEKRAAIQSRRQKARIAYNAAKERVSGLKRLLSETGANDSSVRASVEKQIVEAEKNAATQLNALRDAIAAGAQFQTKQYHEDIEQHEALIRVAVQLYEEKAEEVKKRFEQMSAQESKQLADLEQQKTYLQDARKEAETLSMRAPRAGAVTLAHWLFWHEDRPIRMGMSFGQIPNDNDWRVIAVFPQVILPRIRQDMPVTVRFLNPSISVPGRIEKIQGTQGATIKVDSRVKGLSVGGLALVEIPIARKENVLCVPIESVMSSDGRDFCMVREGHACNRREVTCGVRNNRFVEIVSGVRENDLVLRDPHLYEEDQSKPTK
jgi:multidrug resistance efflux pump